jgi:NDMA-dependent alcohol dehydrogenase
MKAVVLGAVNEPLRVEEVTLDPPKYGEVLVEIRAAGVCHSDYHFMRGDLPISLPCVLGHEGAGVVREIGLGVTAVQPGDHVVLLFRSNCGHCEFCSLGRPALCSTAARIRSSGRLLDGTSRLHLNGTELRHLHGVSCFAERSVVTEQACVPIPMDIPFEVAAVLGCGVMTGVGAVINTASVNAGSSVLVIGAGGVGLSSVLGAALVGAQPIIVADVLETKLDLATQLGATHTINPQERDLVEQVMELTSGEGVDYAFEAIGNPRTMREAFAALRRGGVATAVGIAPHGAEVTVDAGQLVYQEKKLQGSYYGSSHFQADVPRLLQLYKAGKLPIDRLISRRYPLDQVNEAFGALIAGEVARSVLIPTLN